MGALLCYMRVIKLDGNRDVTQWCYLGIKDHEHSFLIIRERKAVMGKRSLNLSD